MFVEYNTALFDGFAILLEVMLDNSGIWYFSKFGSHLGKWPPWKTFAIISYYKMLLLVLSWHHSKFNGNNSTFKPNN